EGERREDVDDGGGRGERVGDGRVAEAVDDLEHAAPRRGEREDRVDGDEDADGTGERRAGHRIQIRASAAGGLAAQATCTNQIWNIRNDMTAIASAATPRTTVLQRERSVSAQKIAATGMTTAVPRYIQNSSR